MEKYKILDKKIESYNNGDKKVYRYMIHIQCNDCKKERWINANDPNYKKNVCRNCNEISYRNEVLTIENENFKVLSIDIEGTKQNSRHTRYFVQCKKCNKIFSRRASVIRASLNSIQCSNCRKNRYNKPLNVLEYKAYCFYRSGAAFRNLDWKLTEDDFKKLIKGNCVYCNESPSRRQSVSYKDEYELVNGIDRVNSKKGYTVDNCVSCCKYCNIMKNDLTYQEFINKISKIYNNTFRCSTTIPKGSTSQANGDGNGELLNATKVKEDDIVYSA